jgi:DNA-binding phage protein
LWVLDEKELLYIALDNAVRARGMTEVAREAGISREGI